ncbi:MAG: tRNA 2-thiocytidine(32) synthetase TtcA [Azovibrio sp.]|uniref:tRNA 2-thiocytidine(32) synthetase TtcA n=1 Tax=Azovibrio sp. TaxID=1872673 RepID=UPI003C74C9E0
MSNTLNKLKKRLESQVGKAIADYNMIEDGDTLLVCVSGGKDSYTLLSILMAMEARAPVDFKLIAMNLDQKQPGFPADVLPAYFEKIGVDFRIIEADTYSVVKEKIPEGKTTCSLCSRLRRGIIYRTAKALGANKIALGHHRDDMVHTLFLNLIFGGKLKAMPPKLVTDDGAHIVIRPLAYCAENDIARYARGMGFPIIPCNLCGSQENLQRQKIREMMQDWDRRFPGRTESVFTALQNVVPSHLADNGLFDFKGLTLGSVVPEGDTVFDAPVLPPVTPFPLPVSSEDWNLSSIY